DLKAIEKFVTDCDFVTLENEFVAASTLLNLPLLLQKKIFPSPSAYALIENKIDQKKLFERLKIPLTPWRTIQNKNELQDFAQKWGYPLVLKVSKGGYDGYGNYTINSAADLIPALQHFADSSGLLVEKKLKLKYELAQVV